jgi:imidazolonepropionase
VGKRADLLIHDQNPLDDFKLLYATGAWRLNDETGSPQWERSLSHTLCAGMVYPVDELLADVRAMVDQSWQGHADERPPWY